MIKVLVSKNKDGIRHIKISGHAGYDEYGRDIVCSAVSSVVTTSINAILSFEETIQFIEKESNLEITVLKQDEITKKLLDNMINLLKEIEKQYKKNISIRTEEKNEC